MENNKGLMPKTARSIAEYIDYQLRGQRKRQKDLAAAIDVPPSTLNSWIIRERDIPAQYIVPIANFLDVSVYAMLAVARYTAQETD